MDEYIQITPAGREVVEARRERDAALAEVKRLRAERVAMIEAIIRAMDDMGTSSLSHHILRPYVGWERKP